MAEEAKAPAEKPARRPVSEEEMRTIYSGPAIASNKAYVTIGAAGVRITFCEQAAASVPPVFRSAVLLSFPDAFALRDVLVSQLAHVEVIVEKSDTKKDG